MTLINDYKISWDAPIIPCRSLAGIPLNACAGALEKILSSYLINTTDKLYRFKNGPTLRLHLYSMDDNGDGGYQFRLSDEGIIHKNLKGTPALSIEVRNKKVFTLTAYNFSFPNDPASDFIYKGSLPGGVKLGSPVSDLLPLTQLEFDEGEEWFYTDRLYGEVEITGWCVPLEDKPNQIITAICVVPDEQP